MINDFNLLHLYSQFFDLRNNWKRFTSKILIIESYHPVFEKLFLYSFILNNPSNLWSNWKRFTSGFWKALFLYSFILNNPLNLLNNWKRFTSKILIIVRIVSSSFWKALFLYFVIYIHNSWIFEITGRRDSLPRFWANYDLFESYHSIWKTLFLYSFILNNPSNLWNNWKRFTSKILIIVRIVSSSFWKAIFRYLYSQLLNLRNNWKRFTSGFWKALFLYSFIYIRYKNFVWIWKLNYQLRIIKQSLESSK